MGGMWAVATWCTLAVWCALCIPSLSHYTDPQTKTFYIVPNDAGTHQVAARTTMGAHVTCSFAYATAPQSSGDKIQEMEGGVTFEELLAPLTGLCVTKKIAYWQYEICFGTHVRQFHKDDSNMLGTSYQQDGPRQNYEDGTQCEAFTTEVVMRRSVVTFFCHHGATQPFIIQQEEPSVCEYHIHVATSLVCNNPNFKSASTNTEVDQTSMAVGAASHEDWQLLITELLDGGAVCSVKSLEMRAAGSRLNFIEYTLTTTTDRASQAHDLEDLYTARHPGRFPLALDEVVVTKTTGGATLTPGPAFDGKLALLLLRA